MEKQPGSDFSRLSVSDERIPAQISKEDVDEE